MIYLLCKYFFTFNKFSLSVLQFTMFKKFTKAEVHSRSNVKASVVKTVKAKIVQKYPLLAEHIDDLLPKKAAITLVKCENKIQLYTINNEVLFWQYFDELIPSLHIVHRFPEVFPKVQVDRGAIKYVLSGANIMCPGLTSKGAQLPDEDWPVGKTVFIYAEGKEHALASGKLEMSINDIKEQNKGTGVELFEYLNDGLWNFRVE